MQAGYLMQLVAMDLVELFPESKYGSKYIVVVSDYFTIWVNVYGNANQEASIIAKTLVDVLRGICGVRDYHKQASYATNTVEPVQIVAP